MAFDVETLLAYWQLLATVVVFLVLIMALLRYRQKKSEIARELLWAFISFFFAGLTQTMGTFFNLYGFMVGSIQIGAPYWPINLILHLIKVFVAAYSVLIIGFYFIYRFSQILIRKPEDKPRISIYIVPIWMIVLILYGIAKVYIIFPPMDEIASIFSGMDVWVVLYSWFVIFPILSESIKLRRKIEKQDPSYAKINYLVAMAIGMVILITCFVLETIYQIAFGIGGPNFFSFLAWIFVIFSIIVAYLALYKK